MERIDRRNTIKGSNIKVSADLQRRENGSGYIFATSSKWHRNPDGTNGYIYTRLRLELSKARAESWTYKKDDYLFIEGPFTIENSEYEGKRVATIVVWPIMVQPAKGPRGGCLRADIENFYFENITVSPEKLRGMAGGVEFCEKYTDGKVERVKGGRLDLYFGEDLGRKLRGLNFKVGSEAIIYGELYTETKDGNQYVKLETTGISYAASGGASKAKAAPATTPAAAPTTTVSAAPAAPVAGTSAAPTKPAVAPTAPVAPARPAPAPVKQTEAPAVTPETAASNSSVESAMDSVPVKELTEADIDFPEDGSTDDPFFW